jgi:hypothetical protein
MSNQPTYMKWWRLVLCGALLAAGCTTVANPASCADGFCHDPALPFCDVDGTIGGGQRLTCIAVSCTPREFEACRGDEAIVCNATGDNYDVTHCPGGCSAETGGCKPTHIIPKYLPNVCDQLATEPELTISESMMLDTGADGSCNGGLIEQPSEGTYLPKICVLHYGTIRIATNKTLTITGYHAIALVSDRAMSIDGVLDVSANGTTSGPGGRWNVSNETSVRAIWPAAPGGAGFKTAGGPGGTATVDGGATNGGVAVMDPALIVPLIGGVTAKRIPFYTRWEGGGGGAATLISCRDTVSVEGTIDAGGGGGQGGVGEQGAGLMPNGGGSGGNVVLQGMNVSVTGHLYANGGGGGAGSSIATVMGASGEDGTRSHTASARGGASQNGEGAGGTGGRASADPGPGKKPAVSGFGAGAGGGSTGFFQTYTPARVTPTLMPVAASPALQPNRTIEMR